MTEVADSADGRQHVGDVVDTEDRVVDMALMWHWHITGEVVGMPTARGRRAEPDGLPMTAATAKAKVQNGERAMRQRR